MRIAYIAAGAGSMYCGACARDATLVRAMLGRGHDVRIIPLYTPLKLEEEGLPESPLFFGGINVYLQQASALFRRLPPAIDRVLDHPGLLRWVSRFAIEVDPKGLGPMTVSVLAGRDGRQRKELERLLSYLARDFRPEVVNLTNSLLSGLAPELKERLGVPVVCTLQGEEHFVQALPEPHRAEARGLIQRNARAVDLFICPCEANRAAMAEFLEVEPQKLRVIPTAVAPLPIEDASRREGPFTVGYLSVIRPEKGLDLLLEAGRILRRDQGREVHLLVAGRVMDKAYWRAIRGAGGGSEYLGEVDAAGKLAMLRRCSAFCVPSRLAEPRGVAVMEAMSAGVPVIVPDHGVFPELVVDSGGGVLFAREDARALARALGALAEDPEVARQMGQRGREAMVRDHSPEGMASAVEAEYVRLAGTTGVAAATR